MYPFLYTFISDQRKLLVNNDGNLNKYSLSDIPINEWIACFRYGHKQDQKGRQPINLIILHLILKHPRYKEVIVNAILGHIPIVAVTSSLYKDKIQTILYWLIIVI